MSLFDKLTVLSLPYVPKAIVRKVASRYIAGSSIDDAVRVVRKLNDDTFCATLDVLGEHIASEADAREAVDVYLAALARIHSEPLDSNISVKLSMLGLQVDFDFCLENVRQLVERAKELGNFVRIDMEDSSCTTDTLNIYRSLRNDFDNVGFVIQAYLRRSLKDIREMMASSGKINVRICKGIYIEPREIAFKDREIINKNFMSIVEALLQNGHYAAIATHDERLVWDSYRMIERLGVGKNDFEFQVLLGVDPQLRRLIRRDGFNVRVYVPYGQRWRDYSIRRLQENPRLARYALEGFLRRNSRS